MPYSTTYRDMIPDDFMNVFCTTVVVYTVRLYAPAHLLCMLMVNNVTGFALHACHLTHNSGHFLFSMAREQMPLQ